MTIVTPQFSFGSDQGKVHGELQRLTETIHPWKLCEDGKGVERSFKFKTFKAAWAFMDAIAASCKTERHHPEWANVYNRVFVRWTTHNPPGLSEKDIKMAAICDEVAAKPGSQELADDDVAAAAKLKHTANQAASAAGDCCTPSMAVTSKT